jgi:hypothetical protein
MGRSSRTPAVAHPGAVAVGVIVVAVAVLAAPAAYAGDPFRGISETINSNAKNWASALICIGLFGVCIRYYFGDADASQHTRNFLWGSIAAIAAGLGLAVYSWVSTFIQIQ